MQKTAKICSQFQGLTQIFDYNFKTVKDNSNLKQTWTRGIVSPHFRRILFLTLGLLVGGYRHWRFSPVTFLMIPIAKIASSYLLLEMGDTFWHMWHHLDAVTWHVSWRQMSMTVVKMHCFYHCLFIEISFHVDVIKQKGSCRFQHNWGRRIQKCWNKSRDFDGWPWPFPRRY